MPVVVNQRYHIRALLGSGAMGRIYVAEDLCAVGSYVALKTSLGGGNDTIERERLAAEYLCLADLGDPRLVRALNFDRVIQVDQGHYGDKDPTTAALFPEGMPFFVRELVSGRPLLSVCRGLHLPGRLELMAQLSETLAHIHDQGWLHQDLKPENVLVDVDNTGQMRVRLLDFGLALDQDDEMAGRSGTALYLAPEVLKGEPYTPRSELYSLGVVLYEVLSGHHPYRGVADISQLLRAQLEDDVDPLLNAPVSLDGLVQSLLSREPSRRPASGWEVAEALVVHLPARALSSRRPDHNARFVGRGPELGTLRVLVSNLADPHNPPLQEPVVWISGPPGFGKSRLLKQLALYARTCGLRVYGEVNPGGGVGPIVRQLWDERRLWSHLPEELEPTVTSDAHLQAACLALLSTRSSHRPLLILFDDLERATTAEWELFLALARLAASGGILLVASCGPPGLESRGWASLKTELENQELLQVMTLTGLLREQIQVLVQRRTGHLPSEKDSETLITLTRGCPRLVEALLEGGTPLSEVLPQVLAGQLPEAVHHAIRVWTQPLGKAVRTLLEALQVLGQPASVQLLTDLGDESRSRVEENLTVAAEAGLVEKDDGNWWFTAGLLAYAFGSDTLRQEDLHLRAATALTWILDDTRPENHARLGQHWQKAGRLNQALVHHLRGARQAEAQFNLTLARDLYATALDLIHRGATEVGISTETSTWRTQARLAQLLLRTGDFTRAERELQHLLEYQPPQGIPEADRPWALWCMLGDAASRRGAFDEALAHLERGLTVVGDHSRAAVLDQVAAVHLRRGQRELARDACHEALRCLDRSQVSLHASIETHLGQCAQELGEYGRALQHLEEARELYNSIKHLAGLADTMGAIAHIYEFQQLPTSAMQAHRESLALKEKLGDLESIATTLQRLSMGCYNTGDFASAVEYAKRSLELARRLKNSQAVARALTSLSIFYQVQAYYGPAVEARQEAIEIWKKLENRVGLVQSWSNQAILYYEVGDFDEALRQVELALTEAEEKGNPFMVARSLMILGTIESMRGEYDKAYRCLMEALGTFEKLGSSDAICSVLSLLADHHGRAGERDKALEAAERCVEIGLNSSRPQLLQARVAQARVLLADPRSDLDMVETALAEAEQLASQQGRFVETLWQVYELEGLLATRRGRPTEAVKCLTRAMDLIYESYQQVPDNLKEIYLADARRQSVRSALEVALRMATRGRRRTTFGSPGEPEPPRY